MKILIANFIQFFSAIVKFSFLQQRLGTRLLYTQFRDFISHLTILVVTGTFTF